MNDSPHTTKPPAKPRISRNTRHMREAAPFLAPLLAFVFAFILVPVTGTLLTSLFRDVSFAESRFVFLRNFRDMLADPAFWQSLRFTLLFILASVPLELAAGLAFALLLNARFPLRGLLRACVLIPWAIPAAVSTRAWELIYNYSFGLANVILLKTGLAAGPVNWLGTAAGAFAALVIADAWKMTPFCAIILLAGLQSIPDTLYEQARIDGAGLPAILRHVTLPLLKTVIIATLLFRTIDGLRVFDVIYVLTRGGPGGATTSVSLYAYRYYSGGDFGFGAAASVLLFVTALALALVLVRGGRLEL